MKGTTTLLTLTAAPSLHPELLFKRASGTVCGDLRGSYPNAEAPICTGQTSICTFSAGLQGCCDSRSSCRFYTTCNGPLATATCTGSQCLACPKSAPYCTKYNFFNTTQMTAYDGYSCGIFDVGQLTIFGVVGSATATTTTTSTSTSTSASTTSSSASGASTASRTSTSSTPTSNSASTTTTRSVETTVPLATASAAAVSGTASKSNTGAIVGGIIGGVVVIVLLVCIAFFVYRKFFGSGRKKDGSMYTSVPGPEIQQHYGHDEPEHHF